MQFVASNDEELSSQLSSQCEPPKIEMSGTCQTPAVCRFPLALNRRTNTCVCNAPNLQINGVCQTPKSCTAPAVLNFMTNTCVCNAPNTFVNNICKAPTESCPAPSVKNPITGACSCNSPNLLIYGVCQPPTNCTAPAVLNTSTNTCACNAPNLLINGVCKTPVICQPPSVLNSISNTCLCNAPNITIDGICKAPPQCTQEEVLKATRSYFKSFTVAATDIANNCVDAAVPNPNDNMISVASPSSIPRFFNTCGNRYCNTKIGDGYIEGRVVEYHDTGAELECRKKDPPPEISDSCKQKLLTLPSPIELKSASDTEIATSCIDSNFPTLAQNIPLSEADPDLRGKKTNRWNFICATRWCKTQSNQFTSGRVTESIGGSNSVNCYREEIFNSLDVGTISTTIKTTLDNVALNCIDNYNPTLVSNYPTTTYQHLRLINTCGRRYCMNKAGAKSGYVINMSGTTGSSELTLICVK